HYIYIQRGGEHLMLKDTNRKYYTAYIAVGVGIFLIVLFVLLYIAILKKLSPLKRLYKEIKVFASGDMSKRITYTNRDEIGKIAKSFDDAILHINELNSSKNLFMRNIMHELKTPITKGRIIIESIDDQDTKEILVRVFSRMNELIDELATIERVTAKGFIPNIEQSNISDIVKKSMELLMFEANCEVLRVSNDIIQTDIKLLSLAVKNILDNGIKYSKNKKVSIIADRNRIEAISEGEPLKNSLEFYTQPFSQEEKRSGGFGLGLYIVQNIVDKLNYKLQYRHEDGKNIFAIIF
ncbi:MAG: ArsS family sensor histidine kinase, partial [Nitrososphaeraceae archaeon]